MSLRERLALLSPEKLAILERRLERGTTVAEPECLAPRSRNTDLLPLSFAQQRLWLLEQIEPGHSFYNLPLAIRLSGPVIPSVLERSLHEVVRRHEALRTTFTSIDGTPFQVIAPELVITIDLIDLGNTPAADREAEAATIAMQEAQQPFDLRKGPLLRGSLIRLNQSAHVLLLTMHHIVSDGWSMGILYRELSAIYSALMAGRSPSLPALPTQYADFAIWQRKWLQGDELERLLAYWKGKLAGMPALLEIPTDRPRPRVQVFQGASYTVALPGQLLRALKGLALSSNATLFMVLLTAFKVLLCQYSGRTDVVVGSPIANRPRREFEGLIGFFVNTLVLRTDLSGDPGFTDALDRVRETAIEAFAHQDLPFEKLVEELQPIRDLSHNPLFQVAFALQNADAAVQGAPGPGGHIRGGTSKFDLTLSTAETDAGLAAAFEYNTELFNGETVAAIASQYQALLENVLAHPEYRVSEHMLPSDRERGQIIASCKGPETEQREDLCMPQLCELQARIRPDALALTFEDQQITWSELNRRASKLGGALRAMGAGPNNLVAVCLERSLHVPIAILGILRAGAAFVPLDPAAPAARLGRLLADTGARILVTEERRACAFSGYSGQILRINADSPGGPETEPDDFTPPRMDDLAYIIYTSGSTGQPKGVMVPHRGLCNVVAAQRTAFAFDSGTRILQFAPLSFDASIFELLLALGSGGTLCLASRDNVMPGMELLRTLRENRIQVLVIPPSSLAMLPVAALPDLTTIISAGEALPRELVSRWAAGRRFFNAYGPTETTIWATLAECTDADQTPTIGRPIANTQVYVLNTNLQPVPPGVPGEIFIGGVGVARGYFGRPDLTAEQYVSDPFSSIPANRLYRTGDRARRLPSGEIQFLGRTDQQLKIRGYRIEPGEIEAGLLGHPAVKDAVVFGCHAKTPRAEGPADTRIAAFCVRQPGQSLDTANLRAFLRQTLPDYMVPSVLKILDTMPLTASGKADRAALAALATETDTPDDTVAPRNSDEHKLASIWREVLELEHVGVHEDFFNLGGHSLLATRVISRVNDAFRTSLPSRVIFENPSIAELAKAVQAAATSGGGQS
jgi:amino acid adenylation domain-containing protein